MQVCPQDSRVIICRHYGVAILITLADNGLSADVDSVRFNIVLLDQPVALIESLVRSEWSGHVLTIYSYATRVLCVAVVYGGIYIPKFE